MVWGSYSARPKPGATVSTPLEWKEVKPGLHTSAFIIKIIKKRGEKKGDLFAGALGKGIDLSIVLKKIGKCNAVKDSSIQVYG